MYETVVLTDFVWPELDRPVIGESVWIRPQTCAVVLWASPLAFRRAGIWARLLGSRPWFQVVLGATRSEMDALIAPSLSDRTVLASGQTDLAADQVVVVLFDRGRIRLALQDSPTESAWERFESEMTEVGLV